MNLLLSRRILLTCLLFCCSFSFAQKKIIVKYYENNTEASIENVRIFFVTKTDTITPKVEDGKIRISSKIKDNFSVFAQISGRTMLVGSYRPATFKENDAIIFGRITDFSTMKRYWETKEAFILDKEYVIVIPNYENVLDVIYCSVKKDVNISQHSNFTKYAPSFTFVRDVIKTKG
ncbi:hypothetical protein [Flavobacterium terrisoli]|uniref:hypothetical protein n=1 Tax=Flavobacterium terrisoli TaxID=3242195 RepID=UPI0025434558|nr:hypothetical protein [Flavobacterium buctense]